MAIAVGLDAWIRDNHHPSVYDNIDRRPSVSTCHDMTKEVIRVAGCCDKNRRDIVDDLADNMVDHRKLAADLNAGNCRAVVADDTDSRIAMKGHSVPVDSKDQMIDRIVRKAPDAIFDHSLGYHDHETFAYCSLAWPIHSSCATESPSKTAAKVAAD